MRKLQKLPKLVQAIIALLLVAVPLTAYALSGPRQMDGQLRPIRYPIDKVSIPGAADVTIDQEGVVLSTTIWDGAACLASLTVASPLVGTLPYAAKVRVDLVDGGAATGAITCGSVVLRGKDQFGRSISETISTLTETEQISARVYEQIDYISFATCACASGGDTSDLFQVSISSWVGLPRKLRTYADIISMCFSDTSDSALKKCYRGAGTLSDSRESLEEAAAVDLDDSAVDVADATLDAPLVDGDLDLVFIMRANDPPSL